MARTKRKTKNVKAKTSVDKRQDRRIAKIERMVDTSKKQLDTYYKFGGIFQPAGNPASGNPELGVAAVSLLEGIGPAEVNPAGSIQQANTKKNRGDSKIELENLSLQMRLYASNNTTASNIQEVYVAVIRSKNYQPYSFGQPANLVPTGNPNLNQVGHVDNLLLEITNSNPTVGPGGATGFLATSSGFPTIIGNAPPQQAFGPTQFMRPMWATESKYHYEVLYAKKHRLVKSNDGSNRFGVIGFKDININLKKKVKGLKVSYAQGASLSGTQAFDVNENNIYLCMWSDQTTDAPGADVASRVKWFD